MVKMKIFEKYMERQSIKAQTRGHWVSKAEREEMMKNKKMASEKKDTAKFMEQLGVEYTWSDKFLHPFIWIWVRIEDAWRNFCYRCQRFKKGYSDRDVWEMRDWFIRTAKPMLRELSAKAYNYPAEVGEEQWRELLLEMAELLEVMDIWEDGAARKAAGVAENDRSEEAYRLIGAEKEKAKSRFFFFFNKYFYDLWY
jgi:hypothetical protein